MGAQDPGRAAASITHQDIVRFYIPLCLNQVVMTLMAPVLGVGASRGADPQAALAGFSVAFSLSIIFNGLILSSIKVYNAHVTDAVSYGQIRSVYLKLGGVFSLVLLGAGTPMAGEWIFARFMGLGPDTVSHARAWLVWSAPVPVLTAIRCGFQSVAMVYKQTRIPARGTLIRLLALMAIQWGLVPWFPHHSVAVCGVALCAGIFTELLFLHRRTRKLRRFDSPTAVEPHGEALTAAYIFRFSFPLWVSSVAWTSSYALTSFFVSRTAFPQAGQAGFGVLRALTVWGCSPLYSLSTLFVILGRPASMTLLKRFSLYLGLGLFALAALVYATEMKPWLLGSVYRLSGQPLAWTSSGFILMVPIPFLLMLRCVQEGVLMQRKITSPIGVTGGIRVLVVLGGGFAAMYGFPELNGVWLGMGLMLAASLSDVIFLALMGRKAALLS